MSKFERLKLAARRDAETVADLDALSPMDKRVKRRFVTPRGALMAGLLLFVVAVSAFGYWRYGLNRTLTVGAERLTVSTVSTGIFREYIPVTGNVVPKDTVYLDAVEGGQVTQVMAEEGATVVQGQPLLQLKNTNLQLQVVTSEAQLAEQINNLNTVKLAVAQNQLAHKRDLITVAQKIDDMERKLSRSRKLIASGATPRAEVEDMEADLGFAKQEEAALKEAQRVDAETQAQQVTQMQTAVDRITASLDIARQNLDNLVMKAPISGQLTLFEAKLGESKAPGQRIGQIDDVGGFKVSAYVDEFYLNRIVIGQVATAEIGGKDVRLDVAKIYPNVRDRQFQVDLTFEGTPPQGIRRGQTLRMNLEIGAEAKSLLLANGPYVDDTGGNWVFVVSPGGGEALRRSVTIGRRNPDMVEVTGGLKEGERVITSSYTQFTNFDRIDLRQGNG
jgi:HlyD family secretion protein